MNSPRNDKETLRDILLQKFEEVLDYVEMVLKEELPDATRMKNISNYTLLINGKGEIHFTRMIFKKFEIVKIAKVGFMEDVIQEFSSKIKSGEFYIVPDYTRELEFTTLYILKKKDKIDKAKQGVKDFLDRLFPSPEPQYY